MFSNRIANSAKFLQMPAESQLLYFHMVLRADDDGVVESYPLIKLLGVAPDVFKVLLAKGFIQQLNDDQVIIITDWLEHNTIRADRKIDSIYKHLLPESIKTIEAKPRSDVEDNSKRLGGQSMDGISQVKLGKVKIENSPSYLKEIPEEDIKEFYTRFDTSISAIKSKAESLLLYCQSKGRTYKNYKAFLLNALKKDFSERKSKNVEPLSEGRPIPKDIKESIKSITNKFKLIRR